MQPGELSERRRQRKVLRAPRTQSESKLKAIAITVNLRHT
jgi:hypothetical protein